ncbi:MAG: type I-C CRISPR-associated protein Cas5 [Deltaproteobacteria bacterium]|uniref:type I-C CRISPR-associated protein Cas5c n=1 Tax=Desulfobacula sp. TaxID=2593537 RepID=UPI0019899766|nr:type I-C CRISPR-associated protein Cas5 [Candidatus Desulfobacula maris]MBL6995239.1 type I-C CRISPR-associated protein Cas5 [Desulfobacula sp.]
MKGFCLEVSGPYACFTRPEMKVERVSYDVITPSAARAIFDAILWKPAIFWQIKRIELLSPIRWISVRRNEVGTVESIQKKQIFIDDGKNRQQRAGLFLRDVKYRLFAEFDFIPPETRCKVFNPVPEYLQDREEQETMRKDETPAKYAAMFERRAKKGQCFNQPYLGCREFSAHFRLVNPLTDPAIPVSENRDLGWMLYDLDFSDPADIKPLFFRPEIKNGVISVPDRTNTGEVRG